VALRIAACPLITNRPVITLSYKYRLFERAQDGTAREGFLLAFKHDTHEFPRPVDHRGVDLISDALPFGRLWYSEPNAVRNAVRAET
jgi:hypothetical protein